MEEYLNKKVFVVGDIHGQFKQLIYELKRKKISDSLIIIAGDIGLGFESPIHYDNVYNGDMKKYLEGNNVVVLAVRGNHDDPKYFNGDLKLDFPNFKTVPDYTTISTDCGRILCIGGATSIDRQYRKDMQLGRKNKLYWENEAVILSEEHFLSITLPVDYIVTHTCPHFCYPNDKNQLDYWAVFDDKLLDDVNSERMTMSNIFLYIQETVGLPKKWFYGHFHEYHEETIKGVEFVMLPNIERTMGVGNANEFIIYEVL